MTTRTEFWPSLDLLLSSSFGREFVAGGIGGVAGVISGQPFDTLRIHLQKPSNTTTSSFQLLRFFLACRGPSAFYKGMAAPTASIAFQNAIVFQAYGVLSRAFDSGQAAEGKEGPPSYRSVFVGGVGAGGVQSVLLSPVELLKIRLQLNHRQHRQLEQGPMNMARGIVQREGIRGLFRGLPVTILRDAPSQGVYFLVYEQVRELMHPGCRANGGQSVGTMLVAGGLAGVASWVSCYPVDVVKTRLQGQRPCVPRYEGIVDCFRKSVREEGHGVLWRGLGLTLVRAFVVNGAVFVAYEASLRFCSGGGDHSQS
ncbi:hypothetical protein ACLOJK_020211 [Asimina triloba]